MENRCKFEMDLADIVRAELNKLENPEDKYKMLNMIDNFLHRIREDIANEWTWCGVCTKWVKVADRKVSEECGYRIYRCGTCGGLHRREKV